MRMLQVKVLTFDELSEDVQQKVISEWRNNDKWNWFDEWQKSLEDFCCCTGLHCSEFESDSYGNFYCSLNLTHTPNYVDDYAELIHGVRLQTWLINNWLPEFKKGRYYSKYSRHSKFYFTYDDCPLTGYCGDMELIQPVLDCIKDRNSQMSLEDLIKKVADNFVDAVQKDYEYWLSDDCIKEEIEINDYEFYENGDLV